jgi:hypothetical protein
VVALETFLACSPLPMALAGATPGEVVPAAVVPWAVAVPPAMAVVPGAVAVVPPAVPGEVVPVAEGPLTGAPRAVRVRRDGGDVIEVSGPAG